MFFLIIRVLEGSAFLTGGYNWESSDIENRFSFNFLVLANNLTQWNDWVPG